MLAADEMPWKPELQSTPLNSASFGKVCMDKKGTHILACRLGNGVNERHRQLQFDVATFARKAGYGVIVEKKISFHNEGKRADLIIQRGSAKQDLVIDITVGLPTCDAHVGVASKTPNATIAKKKRRKIQSIKTTVRKII